MVRHYLKMLVVQVVVHLVGQVGLVVAAVLPQTVVVAVVALVTLVPSSTVLVARPLTEEKAVLLVPQLRLVLHREVAVAQQVLDRPVQGGNDNRA